jgi:hypothetical protein
MSDQTASGSEGEAGVKKKAGFGVEELALIVLLVLSLMGIAMANLSQTYGLWYWLAMVPIFAMASMAAGWRGTRDDGLTTASRLGRVWRQLLHWASLALLVLLIHWIDVAGRISSKDAGLVALLAFALTTFLAGIHFDWRLMVLGAVLGVAATAAVVVEEFLWAIVVPAVVVGMVVFIWRRRGGGTEAPKPAASSG